ncbi:hypothetical protein [Brasilonema sp. UFV-L1]|uniref:hypothetical protein n=1 Tax=Brasilonema sp. UFV-L1 TaxID=2234130 RepID=UPI00145E8E33|nr:hypothetical protein [Brasilonema sp. UFV-L1]NMG05776.1 hypothetical protein [Brasilonema sp. UFV-L1]
MLARELGVFFKTLTRAFQAYVNGIPDESQSRWFLAFSLSTCIKQKGIQYQPENEFIAGEKI